MSESVNIVELALILCGYWLVGFVASILFTIPFHGIKQVLDVASDASGEIRGA